MYLGGGFVLCADHLIHSLVRALISPGIEIGLCSFQSPLNFDCKPFGTECVSLLHVFTVLGLGPDPWLVTFDATAMSIIKVGKQVFGARTGTFIQLQVSRTHWVQLWSCPGIWKTSVLGAPVLFPRMGLAGAVPSAGVSVLGKPPAKQTLVGAEFPSDLWSQSDAKLCCPGEYSSVGSWQLRV